MSDPNFLTHCSFCQKPRDEIALVVGPEVSICSDCVVVVVRSLVHLGTNRMLHVVMGRPPSDRSWSDELKAEVIPDPEKPAEHCDGPEGCRCPVCEAG
jgi:hypothetical protein